MRILVTNDDGIYSPGLFALAEAAASFGDVLIVAPDVEQSSMGHAVTHARPLRYRRTPLAPFNAYRVNGTPADCVALGCYHWERVDVVLSGINLGPNIGNGMWHSGTLAAAKQAALFGLQGIALSTPVADRDEPEFERLKPFVKEVLEVLLAEPRYCLVNVNFPEQPTGICWTRQSVRHYDGRIVPAKDAMDRDIFWFTVRPIEETETETDRWAMEQGLVSMTPLRLDLTNHDELQMAKQEKPLKSTRRNS